MSDDPVPLLVTAVANVPPGEALDLACGRGRHAIFLAARGWHVTAVDRSSESIRQLREAAAPPLRIDARVADLEAGEFDLAADAYDLICDFFYLYRPLLLQIRSGVRPGGLFVATIHMVDTAPEVKPMNPAYLLAPGELLSEFAAWDILRYDEVKPDTQRRRVAELVARQPVP